VVPLRKLIVPVAVDAREPLDKISAVRVTGLPVSTGLGGVTVKSVVVGAAGGGGMGMEPCSVSEKTFPVLPAKRSFNAPLASVQFLCGVGVDVVCVGKSGIAKFDSESATF
jgi:hypothetical protein